MYLYASEHALMDYHLNAEKKPNEEVKEVKNESNTDKAK
jgi:hypothetical protein